ncbi:hypothetical protein KAU19_00770 [Candidatus Parcubacteria bacterium]|nr:hypothetical protein [Candidatus Parcubacteria bacterium]
MPPTSQSNLIKPRIKETKIKKLTIQLKAAYIILIIVIISAAFIILDYYLKQYALAVTGNYSKTVTDELTANDWNNLLPDFVDASGDTMNGDLNVIGSITATNQICDSTGCISLISGGAGWSGAGSGQMHPTALTDKIGINTDTPAHELVVRDANGQSGIYIWGDSSNAEIALGDGANHWAIYSDETNTDDLRFWRDSDRMVITDTGKVGIGTAGPSAKLEVEDGGISAINVLTATQDDENIYGLRVGNDTADLSEEDGFLVKITNSAVAQLHARSAGADAQISFHTGDSERVRITSAGNIGIGTTNPESKLHVDGRIQQGGGFYTYAISGSTPLNTQFSHDIYTCGATHVVHIEAAITHWSAGYRATVDKIFYMDSYTTLSADTILETSTETAGSWSFQRIVTGNNGYGDTSNKLRITHNAGTYHGGAHYYIYIKSTCPISEY